MSTPIGRPRKAKDPIVKKREDNAAYQEKRRGRYRELGLIPKALYVDAETNDLLIEIANHLGFDMKKNAGDKKKHSKDTKRDSAIVAYAIRKLAFDLGLLEKIRVIKNDSELQLIFMRYICRQLLKQKKNFMDTPIAKNEVVDVLNESKFIKFSDIYRDGENPWDLRKMNKAMKDGRGLKELNRRGSK